MSLSDLDPFLPKNAVVEPVTPSYLELLHEADGILIRKKKGENGDLFNNACGNNALTPLPGNEDLNLTGTPLECPFQSDDEFNALLEFDILPVKWRKNEENHFPFKITDAVTLLTSYNLGYKGNDSSPKKTVWVACDGKDPRSTTLMGLLIDSDWRIRKTVCQTKIKLDGIQAFGDRVKKAHIRMSGIKENNLKCKITVVYHVLRKAFGSQADDVPCVKLQSTWNTSLLRTGLTSPPPEAITSLSVEMKSGCNQSEIHHLWNQLVFLHELTTITSRKETAFPETPLTTTDTFTRIAELIKASNGYNMKCGSLNIKDVLSRNVLEVIREERNCRDFTSQLWGLLIGCQNCSEMVECLEHVFDEAGSGQITPYFHPQNKTYLATLLRDLCSGVHLPKHFSLTALRALKMLQEIGEEALERSYVHILLSSNWCSLYQLRSKIPKDNGIAWLGHLHIALDLFLVTQRHLNLPLQSLQSLFPIALKKFQEQFCSFEDVLKNQRVTFVHMLKTADVVCHLTENFASWELKMEADPHNTRLKVNTVCYVSQDLIFPPPLAIPVFDESTTRDDNLGTCSLFTAQLTVIGSKVANNYNANNK